MIHAQEVGLVKQKGNSVFHKAKSKTLSLGEKNQRSKQLHSFWKKRAWEILCSEGYLTCE